MIMYAAGRTLLAALGILDIAEHDAQCYALRFFSLFAPVGREHAEARGEHGFKDGRERSR
jgi:hypothetical protein